MAIDFDKGKRRRDEVLRREALEALYNSRHVAEGGLSVRAIVYVLPAGDAGVQDDAHAMALVRDLCAMELIRTRPLTRRRGEAFGPDHLFATITARGVQLVDQHVPPVPGVDDDRITEGN